MKNQISYSSSSVVPLNQKRYFLFRYQTIQSWTNGQTNQELKILIYFANVSRNSLIGCPIKTYKNPLKTRKKSLIMRFNRWFRIPIVHHTWSLVWEKSLPHIPRYLHPKATMSVFATFTNLISRLIPQNQFTPHSTQYLSKWEKQWSNQCKSFSKWR